jgi:hypothetical protein
MSKAFDRLFRQLEHYYFTNLFLMLLGIIALAVWFLYRNKCKGGGYLMVHILASVLQAANSFFMVIYCTKKTSQLVDSWTIHGFLFVELCCTCLFILKYIKRAVTKKLLTVILSVTITYFFVRTLYVILNSSVVPYDAFVIPQALTILIFVGAYFYEFLKNTHTVEDPLQSPSFWAVTGIFFLISVATTSSLFLANSQKITLVTISVIINISYAILFLTYKKAFLCKPVQPS